MPADNHMLRGRMRRRLLWCAVPLAVHRAAESAAFDAPPPHGDSASPTRRAAILAVLVPTPPFVALGWAPSSCCAKEGSTTSRPFVYSDDWTGTALSVMALEQAVQVTRQVSPTTNNGNADTNVLTWPMARWPDPVLRRPAVAVPQSMFGTEVLYEACRLLQNTARKEGAVGLAAEQCAVDARIIYLDNPGIPARSRGEPRPLVMVNPRIVSRSPETDMRVWKERCLVLPPTFTATVLRDAWVEVAYQDPTQGAWKTLRLTGEAARAFQHEYDHDRGILITDHVSFDEMDSELMATLEADGHNDRKRRAYDRLVLPRPM